MNFLIAMSKIKKQITATNVKIENGELSFVIDGQSYVFSLNEVSEKLKSASEIERNFFSVSPAGYGIHWPLIDEDISFSGLIY